MSRVAYPLGHFPFPAYRDNLYPDAAIRPLGLSLADAMRYYWRARQAVMTVTFSGSNTDSIEDSQGNFKDYTVTAQNARFTATFGIGQPKTPYDASNPVIAVTDETQLVVPSWLGATSLGTTMDLSGCTSSPAGATFSLFDYQPNFSLGLFASAPASGYELKLANGVYLPTFLLTAAVNIVAKFPDGTQVDVGMATGTNLNPANYNGAFHLAGTGTFDGHAFPLTAYWFLTNESGVSFAVDIEITDWWPYADANGNALYNTSTGATL